MLHQDSQIAPQVHDFHVVQEESMSVLAYRSLAVSTPTHAEVRELLRTSQLRNKAERLTGVLVYDRGAYFQWLEGPTKSIRRVWSSILNDPRHHQVTVLREEPIRDRVFEGWDLRIALGAQVSIEAAVAAMDCSNTALQRVIGKPKSIVELSWEDVFATIVIPRLREVHGRDVRGSAPHQRTAAIWHADVDTGEKLARALMAPRSTDTSHFVDSLLDDGANFNALYKEVFEPAQLQLGKLWDEHLCDEFRLTVGLARLQLELERVNAAMPAEHACKPGHSMLLSSQPDEAHRVGLLMSSEVFNRRGWEVMCEFPNDDGMLSDLVHAQWFDVLKLSQSGSLRRDSRLAALRATIEAARAASLNPSLIVMVDGRTFVERPKAYQAVSANAMSASVLEAVPLAERLLQVSRSLTATCQISVSP
jgi:methanogenic corrinoid protein MtbC1